MNNNLKHFRGIGLAGFAACIGVTLLPSLQADTWDKKTILTITEPLQVPSCCTPDQTVTLQPGEYVIMLVDSLSDRHIVRIFDKDQKVVMSTILAIPNYRLKPTGKTVFQYWEVPAGQPRTLRAWFYPGDNFGQEFAYPKQTAAQIAAFVKTPVPAIDAKTTAVEDLKTVPLVAVDESGKTTEFVASVPEKAADPVVPATLRAEATPPVQAAPVQPQAADRAVAETPEPLPATASAMPLVGLAGLMSLALFAALGFLSRRRRTSKA
jgi:LPXTG-motif cell wall-anchored protein